jgi:hypothetical protein
MKTWLRITLSQQRLTQLAILAIHKNRLQNVGMKRLMQTFISKTAERRAIFGKLYNYAIYALILNSSFYHFAYFALLHLHITVIFVYY